MSKKPIITLGVNPGARYLGLAVFCGPELREWRVRALNGRWSKAKLNKAVKIVAEMIGRYDPDALAIKKLHPSRSSQNLNRLAARIKALAKRKKIKVCEYSIQDLEAIFSPQDRINRKRLAEIIVARYPALYHELNQEQSHKNPYHARMFEAVALVAAGYYRLEKII